MMDIDDICSRAKYRPEIYVPALKDELVRLREQEQELLRYRHAVKLALDSLEPSCVAAHILRTVHWANPNWTFK